MNNFSCELLRKGLQRHPPAACQRRRGYSGKPGLNEGKISRVKDTPKKITQKIGRFKGKKFGFGYQIFTRSSGFLYSLSPSFTLKAL